MSRPAVRRRGQVAAIAAVAASALLAGCGSPRPAAPAPAPAAAAPTGVQAFAQRTRERAEAAARQGRLADAATAWEILVLLHPGDADATARLADVRRQVQAGVAEHLQQARAAWKRGELDAASAQYVAVLALQPDHAQAADALRALERERNRRTVLGKPAASTLTRRSEIDAQQDPKVPEN